MQLFSRSLRHLKEGLILLSINIFVKNFGIKTVSFGKILTYRISANSFRGNYSFLEVGVRQVFNGGNYLLLGGFDPGNYSMEDRNYMRKLEYWLQLDFTRVAKGKRVKN